MSLAVPSSASALLAGRYDILGALGDEALGRVWSARDRKNGRLVQVKILTPDLAADPERFARFEREMTASFAAADPNTLEVLDYGDDHGTLFLVLEFVAGTPLSAVVEHGPLTAERSARIVAQVARALAIAHGAGVVHRSLSPETVLLLDNAIDGDFVKVRDFGLAKLLTADAIEATPGAVEITATGTRLGDARYMPPEYVVQGEFGPAGDLYALGAVLFHLLTGEPPFVGSRRDMLARHVSAAVPKPSEKRAGVPPYLDRLVQELLDKAPERRPSVVDLITRIEQGLGGPVVLPRLASLDAAGRPTHRRGHVQDAPPEPARPWGIPGLGCAGTLAVAAVAALVLLIGWTFAAS